jgi:hypothetical protein
MFDPSALGTLIIGLDHAREEPRRPAAPAPIQVRRTRRLPGVRVLLAGVLRGAANRLDDASSTGFGPSGSAA